MANEIIVTILNMKYLVDSTFIEVEIDHNKIGTFTYLYDGVSNESDIDIACKDWLVENTPAASN
ncbi:MAG: hypothetical protein C0625_01640 [Arcobacter sp.]|nr:MAG: hypothetical protein C0625_01640 [Arcobacter sp.]